MQSFGTFDITKYSTAKPLVVITGTNWKYIRIINKSVYFLNVTLSGNASTHFPELFLEDIEIDNSYRGQVTITPSLDLASFASQAPSTQVAIVAYGPNETHNPQAQPITLVTGVGGTVNTSSIQTLSNETNSTQTLVIDIGQTGHTLLITINSDGSFTWSVLQSGTAHQVLKAQITGNPLQLGQSGDISEVLGKLLVDSTLTVDGASSLDNGALTTDGSGNVNKAGAWLGNGQFGVTTNGDVVNGSGFDTVVNSRGGGNILHLANAGTDTLQISSAGCSLRRGTYGFLVGSMSRCNGGVPAAGSGTTISHGLGVTPNFLNATPVGNQPFSATVGIGNAGSSTFQVTVGAGSQVDWFGVVT